MLFQSFQITSMSRACGRMPNFCTCVCVHVHTAKNSPFFVHSFIYTQNNVEIQKLKQRSKTCWPTVCFISYFVGNAVCLAARPTEHNSQTEAAFLSQRSVVIIRLGDDLNSVVAAITITAFWNRWTKRIHRDISTFPYPSTEYIALLFNCKVSPYTPQ